MSTELYHPKFPTGRPIAVDDSAVEAHTDAGWLTRQPGDEESDTTEGEESATESTSTTTEAEEAKNDG